MVVGTAAGEECGLKTGGSVQGVCRLLCVQNRSHLSAREIAELLFAANAVAEHSLVKKSHAVKRHARYARR